MKLNYIDQIKLLLTLLKFNDYNLVEYRKTDFNKSILINQMVKSMFPNCEYKLDILQKNISIYDEQPEQPEIHVDDFKTTKTPIKPRIQKQLITVGGNDFNTYTDIIIVDSLNYTFDIENVNVNLISAMTHKIEITFNNTLYTLDFILNMFMTDKPNDYYFDLSNLQCYNLLYSYFMLMTVNMIGTDMAITKIKTEYLNNVNKFITTFMNSYYFGFSNLKNNQFTYHELYNKLVNNCFTIKPNGDCVINSYVIQYLGNNNIIDWFKFATLTEDEFNENKIIIIEFIIAYAVLYLCKIIICVYGIYNENIVFDEEIIDGTNYLFINMQSFNKIDDVAKSFNEMINEKYLVVSGNAHAFIARCESDYNNEHFKCYYHTIDYVHSFDLVKEFIVENGVCKFELKSNVIEIKISEVNEKRILTINNNEMILQDCYDNIPINDLCKFFTIQYVARITNNTNKYMMHFNISNDYLMEYLPDNVNKYLVKYGNHELLSVISKLHNKFETITMNYNKYETLINYKNELCKNIYYLINIYHADEFNDVYTMMDNLYLELSQPNITTFKTKFNSIVSKLFMLIHEQRKKHDKYEPIIIQINYIETLIDKINNEFEQDEPNGPDGLVEGGKLNSIFKLLVVVVFVVILVVILVVLVIYACKIKAN